MPNDLTTKRPIPRKLNDGMITALSEYIRKGNYPMVACALAGIEWHSLQRWLEQAEKDLESNIAEEESVFLQLSTALKKAEADAEDLMVQTARNAAVEKKDGYLAITFNERRHPDRWGRKDRHQVDITETKQIQITRITVVEPPGEIGEIVEGDVRELPAGEADATE